MNSARLFTRLILAGGLLAVTVGQTAPDPGGAAPDVAGLAQAIAQAPDPSSAIQEYAAPQPRSRSI